jgi:uncharacterized protein DUF2834
MKTFYLAAAIVGTVVPWLFFGMYFADHGVDVVGFIRSLFTNGAAGGFSADVLLSIGVFLIWSWRDAKANDVRPWWVVLPASCFVGLSLALPLYLYLREPQCAPARTDSRQARVR